MEDTLDLVADKMFPVFVSVMLPIGPKASPHSILKAFRLFIKQFPNHDVEHPVHLLFTLCILEAVHKVHSCVLRNSHISRRVVNDKPLFMLDRTFNLC